MTESQQSICEWADATFGVPVSVLSIVERLDQEFTELEEAVAKGDRAKTAEEAADVVIVLARIGRAVGADVIEASSIEIRDPAAMRRARRIHARLWRMVREASPWSDEYVNQLALMMSAVSASVGSSLPVAIKAKMEINRARRWKLDGNGHGQHVEET